MADVVERLITEWDADFSKLDAKLDKLQRSVHGAAYNVEKRLKAVNDNAWDKLFSKGNPGKALDSIFDNTRLKVLDSGVARVGLFGSALEELGAAGIAGAAGIGVLAATLAKARDAMSFADELSDSAVAAQVGVEALQEYRFAALAAGGAEKDADEALKGFSKSLGDAISGSPKALKWFKALGFDRDQLKAMGDVEHALPKVADAVANLGSEAQRAAFADHLGLRPLLPVIEQGEGALKRLTTQARALGIVLSEEMVKKAGDAHDKVEILSKVINLQLMSATADLAPVIVGAMQAVADFAKGVNSFTKDVKDAIPAVERINELAGALNGMSVIRLVLKTEGFDDEKVLNLLRLLNPVELAKFQGKFALQSLGIEGRAAKRAEDMQGLSGRLKSAMDGRKIDTSGFGTPYAPPESKETPTLPGTGKAKENKFADDKREADQRLEDQLAAIARDKLALALNDFATLDQQAKVHQQQLDAEKDEFDRRLKNQEADYAAKLDAQVREKTLRGDQRDALVAENKAANDQLRAQNDSVVAQKKTIQALEDWAKKTRALADATASVLDSQAEIDQQLAGLATTLKERRRLELKALDERHRAERERLSADLAVALRGGNADEILKARQRLYDSERKNAIAAQGVMEANRSPLEEYQARLGRDPATRNEELAVEGLSRFGDALTDAIFEAQDFGEALKAIGRDLAKELFRDFVDQQIIKPAANFVSGLFGSGGAGGAAAGVEMTAAITAGGAAAASEMGLAITAAGTAAAAQLAGAMAAGSFGGGGGFGLDLLSALPGFASGTSFAPGGLALVGERGPEIVNLPRGSQVIPNHALGLLNMGVPRLGGGGVSVTYAPVLHVQGGDPEAVRQIRAEFARHKAELPAIIKANAADAFARGQVRPGRR